ncbi:sodium:solute symporter family protein [Ornithinibacillus halotolerans]|uniref:Pantothenate permease n=1 Tax=Ornithinibacillus halotolerans TaxID=1274357 RepID=A0A916SAS2_9BACI|nr:sodium:solute symporter family protein [Ornithinibacillus halotolerans]GGA89075.1 pantothenate permease [Ornithinibacillus halotolerans]
MSTSYIIWGIIIYTLVASFIAILSRKGNLPGMSGYFIGNRKMNGVLSALSYSATTFSAFMMVGLAGLTYKGGIGALGFEIVYFTGVSLILIFGPRFWLAGKKNGYVTPSEMLGDRYQSKTAAIVITIMSCLFLIPYSAVQLAGIGYLLQGMTDNAIPYSTGVLIAIALALFFSYAAGIRSVVWTDSLQAIFMIITSTAVVLFIVHSLGGFGQFFNNLETNHAEILTVPGNGFFSIFTFISMTIPWFFFSISNPQVSQRLFMPNSFKGLRQMLLGFLVFGLIYTFVSVMWGLSAVQLFPNLENADLASPNLLSSDLVPPVLGVIVMVGILAAAVSTIDSIMLTLSSMFARDVYGNISKKASDKQQLKVGKIVIPVIAILAYAFAELELNLIAVLSVAASSGLIVAVPAIFGTFFWKRGTALGVIVSVTVSALIVLILEATGFKPGGLGSGVWGLLISTILFVGVSLATKPPVEKANEFFNLMKDHRSGKKTI